MVGIPAAFAFAATAEPTSPLIAAMISTFTPWAIMPSASVENFWTSPWAFSMSTVKPCAVSAFWSIGLSKPSQRAEVAVSGRMTPTLPLAPPPAGADTAELEGPVPPGVELLAPQAVSTRLKPTMAATRVRVLVRILGPSGFCRRAAIRDDRRSVAHMLLATTYAGLTPDTRGLNRLRHLSWTRFGNSSRSRCAQQAKRPALQSLPGTESDDA